ncbi:MAG: leucine-rich repeat protein [Bacillota bacterium]
MKKIVTVMLVLVLALGTMTILTACNTSIDGMEYKLSTDDDGNQYYTALLYTDSTIRNDVVILDEIDGIPVTAMGVSCFTQCSNLYTITIGKNMANIDNWGITNNTYLKAIYVDEENENYCSVEGILYSKDCKELICYPNAIDVEYNALGALISPTKSVTIAEGVEVVTNQAFYNCYAVSEIIFSSTVKEIGGLAFLDCTSLESIIFNEGLEVIGENCFLGCTSANLTEVTLPSTIKELYDGAFYGCKYLVTVNINVCQADLADIYFQSGWQPCSGGKTITGNIVGSDFSYAFTDWKGV